MRTRTVVGTVAGLVVAVAVVAVAVPVVLHSDALTTTIRTAPDNPPKPEIGPLPDAVRRLWTVPTTATDVLVEGPSVIATGTDRVTGLDPATGRERWSYQRGNARLCSATEQDTVVLALFAKSHGCRDLIGLDAATGQRRWTRTLELTGDVTLTSGPGVVVAASGDQLIAVDDGGGLNRWTYRAAGCRLDPAVAGTIAVVTVARCAGGLNRLVVHLPYTDKAPWVGSLPTGSDPHVLTADARVSVFIDGTVLLYSTSQDADGKITAAPAGEVRDDRLAGTSPAPAGVMDSDFLVVWTGTRAVGVDTRNRTVLWAAAATGPPMLADGQVLLAGGAAFTVRPASTGTPVTTVPAGTVLPAAAGLSRIGHLVVLAGAGRLVAYG